MYRLFVAIDPPEEIKTRLSEICYGMPGAKWLQPEQMHITLKFIGEVDGAVLREAREALATIHVVPFEVTVKGVGFFPPRGDPQMLWAGIDGNDRLVQMRNKIETTLERAGIGREKRKFAPHIGLANVKQTPPPKVAGYLAEFSLLRLPPFEVSEFCLYSSHLGSERAIHTVEEVYPLSQNVSEAG
jgi:2'-5' RNA ligase